LLINGQHIKDALIETFVWIRNRGVYHTLFWIWLYIALFHFEDQSYSSYFRLGLEFINVIFYAALVYFNIFFLVPKYLTGKQLWTYIMLLALSCMIITPLKVIVLFFVFNQYQDVQVALIENQHWYFSTFLLTGGVSTVYAIITEWKKREKDQQELQTKTVESELRFLKTQINPHFLFNTLNSLYALTIKKSDNAPEVVLMLSEMMRYMLYECNEPEVPLSKEVNYIENYLNLEKLRVAKNSNIRFEVEGKINHQKITPLLFIPFIENSFKHGMSNQIKNAFITIKMQVKENNIVFTVKNSKPQVLAMATTNRKSGGIGLVNVKRRLDLLYPEKNELTIDDNIDEYSVRLIIELK
jgi:two-component system, LytTR family, sensor kinase